MLELFNNTLNLFIYVLNIIGDIIPPCFTLLETVIDREIALPYLMQVLSMSITHIASIITMNNETFLDKSF